ncbi:MAG: peptidoglycan-binding protein LysM [Acidobacteriota bacterium]|nr:peptidoglycan-binding protein LysM [Acidobacteriota bacterium]MDH3786671.1 peptidoglycan-binding protein LysM [Acidobacteriota bacterium]
MGLFDFVKDAGEKMFGGDDKDDAKEKLDQVLADKKLGISLTEMVTKMDLGIENARVKAREGVATLSGVASSQAARERAVLFLGNTQGIAQVDDQTTVEKPEPEATMYTVQSGDSLSKIAKAHYGNAMKYTDIFEANKPMLKDPNKIYPGQVLRIPPKD